MPTRAIYEAMNLDPSTQGWIKIYRAEPTQAVLDILAPHIENSLVIGFELPPFIKSICDRTDTPYVSLAIHPVRFLADYCFMIGSNCFDHSVIEAFKVPKEDIVFGAQLKRVQSRNRSPLDLEKDSLVLFGQVDVDAALIKGDRIVSLQDHASRLADLVSGYEHVYFKPHPYHGSPQNQISFVSQICGRKFNRLDANPYAVLAAPEVRTVAALTSSILTEGLIFGTDVQALSDIWIDRSDEPAYGLNILSPLFWETVTNQRGRRSKAVVLPPRIPQGGPTLKEFIDVSWEDFGTPALPRSGKEIPFNEKLSFGTDTVADQFCVGPAWMAPSHNHRWLGRGLGCLSFRVPAQIGEGLELKLDLSAMANKEKPISCQFLLGNSVLETVTFDSPRLQEITVPIPSRLITALGDIDIEIAIDGFNSPKALLNLSDQRPLSICAHAVELRTAGGGQFIQVGQELTGVELSGCCSVETGWNEVDEVGVWSRDPVSSLSFHLGAIPDTDLELRLSLSVLLSDYLPFNALSISVGGIQVSRELFRAGESGDTRSGPREVIVPVPRATIQNDEKELKIEFALLASLSPLEAGISVDHRKLGLFVHKVKLCSAIGALADLPSGHVANVFGPFNIHTGLAVMARNGFGAIEEAQQADRDAAAPEFDLPEQAAFGPRAVNFNNSLHQEEPSGIVAPSTHSSDVNIFMGDVTRVDRMVTANGNRFLEGRYNICYGAWELERLPTYLADTRYIDEYWGLSTFIADAARARMDVPVHAFPIPVELHYPEALTPRSHFGIPEDKFCFLFTFSVDSTMARKNPEAVLDAFQLAFPDKDAPVCLVIKSMIRQASTLNRRVFSEFRVRAQMDPRVILVEETLDRDQNASLYMASDAYVSLHRAEGFGLTIAEAMGHGKPAIATAYSGNLDFMRDDNSCLVDFDMIPMEKGVYHNQLQSWADPHVSSAAGHMQRVYEDVVFREKIARRGQETILTEFSKLAVGRKILARISEIYGSRK